MKKANLLPGLTGDSSVVCVLYVAYIPLKDCSKSRTVPIRPSVTRQQPGEGTLKDKPLAVLLSYVFISENIIR